MRGKFERFGFVAVVALAAAGITTGCMQRLNTSGIDGTWVHRAAGQNIFKLTLAMRNGVVTGSITQPKQMSIDQDGDVTKIGVDRVTMPIQGQKVGEEKFDLMIDGDHFVMSSAGADAATLALPGIRPMELERVARGSTVVLATSLPGANYSNEIRLLREKLQRMVKAEQDARMAFDEAGMEAEDAKNQPEVLRIYSKYGWVTKSLAGKSAAHDFWLLVQHQTPEIQRRLLPALERAAKKGDASMSEYAYLYDRVQIGLHKPQRWGSQTRCEKHLPVLSPVEDAAGLDARRKALFMLPVSEYLKMDYLVKVCAASK